MATLKNVRAKNDCIKNPSKYDEDRQGCLICLEPASSPLRCKTCRTVFCKTCAKRWTQQKGKCPKKCSDSWDLEPVPTVGVRLCCPVSKKCPIVLNPDNFEQHKVKCRYLKPIEESVDINYFCLDAHELTYIASVQDKRKLYQKCASCLQQLVCRSYCQTCLGEQKPSYYCCSCKFPRGIISRKCHLDHDLNILKQGTPMCDMCSKPAFRLGDHHCFYDEVCGLVVCLQCQKKLPIRRKLSI